MRNIARIITRILASGRFFYAVIAFFVLEALWFVGSAAYPMAFDEDFHFGIIRLFSEHLLPFMSTQPESADSFGAIIRDPSYLYHYLMSFPYRLVNVFTDNQTAIVIVLRLINVALFVLALFLFRKVLLRAQLSPAFAHTALAIFVLVPIVPQLAAHINYDNLLLALVAWMCLLVARFLDALKARRVDTVALAVLLPVCMAGSLVKYEFLPIVAAAVLFVGCMMFRTFRGGKKMLWQKVSRPAVVVCAVVFITLFSLMVQRYGVNLVAYQTLKPQCDLVLSEERCEVYGPWARNHHLGQEKGDVNPNPLAYTWTWLQSLHYRLFFAVSGPTNSHRNYPPLPLPAAAAIIIVISALVALALYFRRVFAGTRLLVFFAFAIALYCGALWAENYSQFLETGQPVAINGRYLLLVTFMMAAVFGRALSIALRVKPILKPFLAAAAIVLFLQGGGVFTFITRSDAAWNWPNQTVIDVNDGARRIISPIIFEGSKFY